MAQTANNNTLPKPEKATYFPYELDPAKKDKAYCLQMCKALYWQNWNTGTARNAFGNPRRDDWVENRQWAIGNPNVAKYAPMFSGLKDAAGNSVSYLNLDLKPVCHIPKFMDIVVSYIEKLEYDITCNAINPEAVDVKNEAKWKIYAAKKMSAWIQSQEAAVGTQLVNTPQFDFDFGDIKELEIIFDMSVKLDEEMMMEIGNEVVLNENQWPLMKRMLIKDLAVLGSACRETYVDRTTDRVRTRYIDMVNVIYPHWEFRGESFKRPSKVGYVEMMTVATLRQIAGDDLTEEDYKTIASRFSNQFGNGAYSYPASNSPAYINTDSQYNYWYSFNIPVFTLYWEETDRYKYQDKVARNGMTYTRPVSYSEDLGTKEYMDYTGEEPMKKSKTTYTSDVFCYYQSKWIPNTDYIFCWGKVPDMGRDPLDPKYPICPLHIYRVSERSLLDRLLPFEEQNMLGWLKLQNTLAKAPASGYSLNINTLKNATIDGKNFPIKHQIELYEQTGRLIWDSENPLDESGRPFPHPIMPLPSTLLNDIQAWLALFDSNIQKMRGVTGINELMDASTPDARTLAGTAKLAVAGSQNALTPIADVITMLQEDNCMDITEKLKLVIQRKGAYDGYAPAIGGGLMKATMDDRVVPLTYGIKVTAMPTQEERMELKEAAKMALVNSSDPVKGGLMYSDYIYIVHLIDSGTNLKLVEAIMRHRINKNLKNMTEMASANSQQQAQMNQQTIAAQAQANEAIADKQLQRDMMLDDHQTNNKIRYEQAKQTFHTQGGIAKNDAKSTNKQQEIVTEKTLTA